MFAGDSGFVSVVKLTDGGFMVFWLCSSMQTRTGPEHLLGFADSLHQVDVTEGNEHLRSFPAIH